MSHCCKISHIDKKERINALNDPLTSRWEGSNFKNLCNDLGGIFSNALSRSIPFTHRFKSKILRYMGENVISFPQISPLYDLIDPEKQYLWRRSKKSFLKDKISISQSFRGRSNDLVGYHHHIWKSGLDPHPLLQGYFFSAHKLFKAI